MRYEWYSVKDALNRRKHRFKLADGMAALEDPQFVFWFNDRFDYGEERILTLGRTNRGILLVVTTELSEDLTRIISVRRAEKHEEYRYYHGRP